MKKNHEIKPFFRVVPPAEAREAIGRIQALGSEVIPVEAASGRVLAERLVVPGDLPTFDRAHMDGYAVRARDTFGASGSLPNAMEQNVSIVKAK